MHHFGARRRPDQMRSSTVAPLLRAVVSGGVSVAGGLYPRLVFPSGFAVGWADAAISTASRQSMPAGGRRSEAGLLYRRLALRGGVAVTEDGVVRFRCALAQRVLAWRPADSLGFGCQRGERGAISTATRRSMPAGGRRSEIRAVRSRRRGLPVRAESAPWSPPVHRWKSRRGRCREGRASRPAGARRS